MKSAAIVVDCGRSVRGSTYLYPYMCRRHGTLLVATLFYTSRAASRQTNRMEGRLDAEYFWRWRSSRPMQLGQLLGVEAETMARHQLSWKMSTYLFLSHTGQSARAGARIEIP